LRWRLRPIVDSVDDLFEHYGPERLVLARRFRRVHGRRIDWRNPTLFNEKIYWIMHHMRSPIMPRLADKYAVREFVGQRLSPRYLNELYGVWTSGDEVDFDALPPTFVLKATHGSGMVLVCRDRDTFDEAAARATMDRWLRTNYGRAKREWAYQPIRPRLIAEALLDNGGGDLFDYKFFCFGGDPRLIQFDAQRFSGHRRELFTPDWRRINTYRLIYPPVGRDVPRPDNLAEMLDCARRLSRGFVFVRVDLYSVSGRTIFGAVTWYPEGGWGRFEPIDAEHALGAALRLPSRTA